MLCRERFWCLWRLVGCSGSANLGYSTGIEEAEGVY